MAIADSAATGWPDAIAFCVLVMGVVTVAVAYIRRR